MMGPSSDRPESCAHLDQIRSQIRGEHSCSQCVALGDRWVHLRQCMTCGKIGCCDSSKNKHASRHAGEVAHPIARSHEPGEEWLWCYVDQLLIEREPTKA